MTDHDQDAAIGNLTKRYSNAKRKRAALISEIGNCKSAIDSFARALQSLTPYGSVTSTTVPKIPENYPDTARLTGLLDDLRATSYELEHTQQLLKDAGVEVS